MDKFFDTVNVHNYKHGLYARKKFQLPYTSGSDHRLKVLYYTAIICAVKFVNIIVYTVILFDCSG